MSTLSGAKPEIRTANHLFVNIERLHGFLAQWATRAAAICSRRSPTTSRATSSSEPLRDWDVSRPAPYFGFEIPDSPGNYWYVWFDAPIGYLASTRQWCDRNGEKFDDWWRSPETEIHHFIGKDITYFHTLFWPAMLKTAGFSLPTKVHIHGFLTVNGEKMSKSKGTFIRAATYLEHLDPAYLRYYYASKLSRARGRPRPEPRGVRRQGQCRHGGQGGQPGQPHGAVRRADGPGGRVSRTTAACSSRPPPTARRLPRPTRPATSPARCGVVLTAAERANKFVEENAPWNLRGPNEGQRLQEVCTIGLNLFRQLAVYLAPVLPKLAEQTGKLLHDPIRAWEQSQQPLLGTPVGRFEHLMQRVDPRKIEAMIAASAEADAETTPGAATGSASAGLPGATGSASAPPAEDSDAPLRAEPLAEQISFEEFAKVDLRVARVVAAEDVPGAKKLLHLTLSLGGGERRNVFAGIKTVYRPEQLVGRLLICAANLAPRKMKFGTSDGMIVAAGGGENEIFLLAPDTGAKPGQRVH